MSSTSIAPVAPRSTTLIADWLPKFIKSELAPYPGRASSVARIVISVVITFILVSTFQIPGGGITLYLVFTVSRDSPSAAVKSALSSMAAVTAGIVLSLIGVVLTIDNPPLRFVWLAFEFFTMFWLVRVLVQPSVATSFGIAVYNTTNIWDLPYPAEPHLERTLWFWASLVIGTAVAALVEVALVHKDPVSQILDGVCERLKAVESFLISFASDPASPETSSALNKVVSYSLVGTGRLRRQLRAAENGRAASAQQLAVTNSVVALTARIVDLSANLSVRGGQFGERDSEQLKAIAEWIERIRAAIRVRAYPEKFPAVPVSDDSRIAILPEVEKTVRLLNEALYSGESTGSGVYSVVDEAPRARLLVPDAFSNLEYLKFALKGCLAATACYVIYTAIDWPGISTSVFTCVVTALSTLGASRQKQLLRICGAAAGGLLAIGAIVFLFPTLDSITTVTLVMAAVAAVGGWIATSSPRLGYFGLQLALAFFLTTLQDYESPTALAPARDRLAGILLGLTMMWLVFDQIWPVSAAVEIRIVFEKNLRLLAKLIRVVESAGEDRKAAVQIVRRIRDQMNDGFMALQAHASTIFFEFGPERRTNLALREQILHWHSSVRTMFLTELGVVHYRIHVEPHLEPENVLRARSRFDQLLANELETLAAAGRTLIPPRESGDLDPALEDYLRSIEAWIRTVTDERVLVFARGVMALSKQFVDLTCALHDDMSRSPLIPDVSEVKDPVLRSARA